MLLPLIGGFNDGKYIEPNGRTIIKMARPSDYSGVSHRENILGFDYEIYILSHFAVYKRKMTFFVVEGMSIEDAVEKLIFGYKQYNKKKGIDLNKD